MKREAKALLMVIIVVLMLFSLCGCFDPYYFDYEDLKEKVQKIEIIDYDSDTQEEVLLVAISETEQDQLLLRLSELEYHYVLGDPLSPKGTCVKLNYKNNECEIISYAGSTHNGFIQCDKTLFEGMLKKYL